MYGITKAPPPFSYAVNGNLQIFPRPTDIAMQDIKNSIPFDHFGLSSTSVLAILAVSLF